MNVKRIVFFCLILCFAKLCFAQKKLNTDPIYRWMKLFNMGAYVSTSGSQPYIHANFNTHIHVYSTDYLNIATELNYMNKKRDTKLSGLKLTPLNLSFSPFYEDRKETSRVLIGSSISFFQNSSYLSSAWVVTPHITYDFAYGDIKFAYDYDLKNKVGQFGITVQFSLTMIPFVFYYANKGN